MVKLLLLSLLLATFLIPVAAARVREPRRSFVSLLLLMATFQVCYAIFLAVFYTRFL